MLTIGFLTYRAWPESGMPPRRLRAMMAEAALQGARFVVLDATSADMEAGLIGTDVWNGSDWIRQQCELPDVVIILGSPVRQSLEAVHDWVCRSRPFIKDRGLDKAGLASLLTGGPCEGYLIEDALVDAARPAESITAFLIRHGGGVIKRVRGQRGIGLLFVSRCGDEWELRKDRTVFRGSLEAVVDRVVASIAGRLSYRDYIVQRLIRSVAADGRAVDIRVHVQRRADGVFHPTRAYVRLGEAGMPLANTSRGGYQGALENFVAQRRVRAPEAIEAEIIDAALKITHLLDATAEPPLSELGVDLLIDEHDRLWLAEVNALPQSAMHEHDRAVHAIGYALSLAKQRTGAA